MDILNYSEDGNEPETILLACIVDIRRRKGGFLGEHAWPRESSAVAAGAYGRTITAERFVMANARGKRRGAMQVTGDGMAMLSLNDADGMDRTELRVAGDGSAGLAFFDRSGHKLAVFGEGMDGRAGIRIFGADGKQTVAFGSLPKGESAFTLYDAGMGRARAGLGVTARERPDAGFA